MDSFSDDYFMQIALRQAQRAFDQGEVPVGAIIINPNHQIIGRAYNQVETLKDATAHAEILALTQAQSAIGDWRLNDCTLYVTKEPCPMCAGAIVHCRLNKIIFGCSDEKGGAAGGLLNLLQNPSLNHQCDISKGILQDESLALLQAFFKNARAEKKKQGEKIDTSKQ